MVRALFLQRLLNLGSTIGLILMTLLAVALPINGVTTREVSDAVPTLVTPAGFTFIIWSVIYLFLIFFAVYQSLPSQSDNARINRIGWWFILANVANIVWLLLWHHWQYALTLIPMFVLLMSLIVIYIRLGIGVKPVTRRDFILVNVPFSLYLGWIYISTVANLTIALVDGGWGGLGIDPGQWAAVMGFLLMILALIMVITRHDFVFSGVIVWGLIGMWFNLDNTTWLAYTIAACAIITAFVTCLMLLNTVLWESSDLTLSIIGGEE